MTWVWGPSFPLEGFWGSPDAKAQDWWGQALWGRAVYTALHGARLSSVPSGDQSANPAVFQGAAVSSERFSQSLPPRNVAERGGSLPLRGSLEQLDRPSPAGPPFQGTELAALSTPETSLERLVPLVDYSAAWNCCQMCLDGSRTL